MNLSVQLFASRQAGETTRDAIDRVVQLAVHADVCGYRTVWLAEHHNSDWNHVTDPLAVLAHLAGRTSRIRLGTSVVNLGLHHPAAIAERAALVQDLSGGRLELGIGKGFATADYERFGLDPAAATERFHTAHDALLDALASDERTRNVPLWLSTSGSERTLHLATEHGHGLLLAATGDKLQRIAKRTNTAQAPVAVARAVHVARDPRVATDEIRPYLRWYIDHLSALQPEVHPPSLEEVLGSFCVVGTAADCARQLRELLTEHSITEVMIVPGIGGMPSEWTCPVMDALAPRLPRGRNAG